MERGPERTFGKCYMLRSFVALVLAGVLLTPLAAQASLVTDPGFDITLNVGTLTVPTNNGLWLTADPSTWKLVDGAAVSTGGVDWLIQGCTLPSNGFGPGWKVNLSFDYQSSGAGQVAIAGFAAAQTWDPAGSGATGTPLTAITLSANSGLTPFKTSFFLPQGSQAFTALGAGFNLAAGTDVSMTVDNVVLELVAPVSFRIAPVTLNLKSRGNFVTGFITRPPAGYHLSDINKSTVQVTVNGGTVPIRWINAKGNMFMMKIDRGALITLLNAQAGPVTLTVTGTFNDGTLFAGDAVIRVIEPGKPRGKK